MKSEFKTKISNQNLILQESKTPQKVLDQIRFFDKKKLRKKMVYMVGGPPESFAPNCMHSFVATRACKSSFIISQPQSLGHGLIHNFQPLLRSERSHASMITDCYVSLSC
jgi:hypothetical protein